MSLDLVKIEFQPVSEQTEDPAKAWAKLTLRFRDSETDHWPSIALDLLLTRARDRTIAEYEAEARARARTILREALAALQAHDVAQLEEIARMHRLDLR